MSDPPAAGSAARRLIGGDGRGGGSQLGFRGRSECPASARVDAQGVRVVPGLVTAVTDSGQRPSRPPREPREIRRRRLSTAARTAADELAWMPAQRSRSAATATQASGHDARESTRAGRMPLPPSSLREPLRQNPWNNWIMLDFHIDVPGYAPFKALHHTVWIEVNRCDAK